jgi:hypothetical protein
MMATMDTQHFDHWFNAATKGLATEEIKLLLPELRGHYEDALQSHLGGLSHTDAATKAVASLGDAKQCNREYHRLYFSEYEYKELFTPAQQNFGVPIQLMMGLSATALVLVGIGVVYNIFANVAIDAAGFLLPLAIMLNVFGSFFVLRYCPSLRSSASTIGQQPTPTPLPLSSFKPAELVALKLSRVFSLFSLMVMALAVSNQPWLIVKTAGFSLNLFSVAMLALALAFFIPTIRKLARFGNDGRRAV